MVQWSPRLITRCQRVLFLYLSSFCCSHGTERFIHILMDTSNSYRKKRKCSSFHALTVFSFLNFFYSELRNNVGVKSLSWVLWCTVTFMPSSVLPWLCTTHLTLSCLSKCECRVTFIFKRWWSRHFKPWTFRWHLFYMSLNALYYITKNFLPSQMNRKDPLLPVLHTPHVLTVDN